MLHPFVRKLRHATHLTEEDEKALIRLAQPVHRFDADRDIFVEGNRQHVLLLLLEGWVCRYRVLENGKRQITSLILPGDLCEPFGVLPRFIDNSLGALTPVAVVPLSLQDIAEVARASPRIDEALWWDLLVSWNIEREHVISLGRRTALERTGHLICELHLRLDMVGLAEDMACDMPVTQADLGDVLGLSTVHVNRSLQELRRAGLISLRGRRLVIRDLEKLREVSLFDAAYLRTKVSSSLRTDVENRSLSTQSDEAFHDKGLG